MFQGVIFKFTVGCLDQYTPEEGGKASQLKRRDGKKDYNNTPCK